MKPIKWFKLLLLNDEDIAKEEVHTATQLQEAKRILSNSMDTTAVQIVAFYLKKVWNHTYAALRSRIDIDNLPLRVAITIPAIWPAYAQSAMREAAKIAGIMDYRDIGVTTLTLVQEPEAAALACLFQRNSSPEIQVSNVYPYWDIQINIFTTEKRVIRCLRCWWWYSSRAPHLHYHYI
jgi:molecular chaperone DnaK (HSP70)